MSRHQLRLCFYVAFRANAHKQLCDTSSQHMWINNDIQTHLNGRMDGQMDRQTDG